MDSATLIEQIESSQAQKEVTANNLFDAASIAMAYGRHAEACSGLTFAYYGVRFGGTPIANGSNVCDASDTTYMIVELGTGDVTFDTDDTDWNDSANFARAYLIVTGADSVTSYEDHRFGAGGVLAPPGAVSASFGSLTGDPTDNADLADLLVQDWPYAMSDRATALSTGTNNASFHAPFDFDLLEVQTEIDTVSSSGLVTVDFNKAGTTVLSTKCSIDASEKTSITAATPAVISGATFNKGDLCSNDIDAAGTGAKGLIAHWIVRRRL